MQGCTTEPLEVSLLTITLPADIEDRLKNEASRRGVDPGEFATRLLDAALREPDHATLRVLSRWEAENHTDDPAEVARRQEEFREFKEAMNRSRLELEGPGSRKPYP